MLLKDGEVQQIGSPLDLYGRPQNRFVAEFIGSPTMNLIEGTVENGMLRLGHLQLEINEREFDAGRYSVGVRPQDVVLGNETNGAKSSASDDGRTFGERNTRAL